MDRLAPTGPAVDRRVNGSPASSSRLWEDWARHSRLGFARRLCCIDCEGPSDVAGIATVRRAGTRYRGVVSWTGPSPGIEGVGRPTLLYRFDVSVRRGTKLRSAAKDSLSSGGAQGHAQERKAAHYPVQSAVNLRQCELNCKADPRFSPRFHAADAIQRSKSPSPSVSRSTGRGVKAAHLTAPCCGADPSA